MYFCLKSDYTLWTEKINTHNIIGWYHSHPSYGCWLSGIDVDTSKFYQNMNDPFINVVIDPIKSTNFSKMKLIQKRSISELSEYTPMIIENFHVQIKRMFPEESFKIWAIIIRNIMNCLWFSTMTRHAKRHWRILKSSNGVQNCLIFLFSVKSTFWRKLSSKSNKTSNNILNFWKINMELTLRGRRKYPLSKRLQNTSNKET